MSKKSRVVSIRLHPSSEDERLALDVLDGLHQAGYSNRQIITDWAHRFAGVTPEMFVAQRGESGGVTRVTLEELLSSFAADILDAINSKSFVSADGSGSEEREERVSLDEGALSNILGAYLNREKR
jgi:hypothetical protein